MLFLMGEATVCDRHLSCPPPADLPPPPDLLLRRCVRFLFRMTQSRVQGPVLQQAAHRLMKSEVWSRHTSDDVASAAINVYDTLLKNLASLVGPEGSHALFRRSVKLAAARFPCLADVRGAAQVDGSLLKAVAGCLGSQAPDLAKEVSLALLIAYLDLLVTFIGERLTLRLVQDGWPDVLASPTLEMPS
jgi:hypothetical protein